MLLASAYSSVGFSGFRIADEPIDDEENTLAVIRAQTFQSLPTLEHGPIPEGARERVSADEIVHRDAESIGELARDLDGGSHLTAFVPANDGARRANLLGKLWL